MKKLSLFLAILMIAMCFASFAYAVDAPVLDETQKVTHAIKGTPTLDGEIDEAWANAEIQTIGVVASGSGDQIKARFRVMWDEDYLYVLHEVVDPTLGTEYFERTASGTPLFNRDSVTYALDVNYTRGTQAYGNADATGYFARGVYGAVANANGIRTKAAPTDGYQSPWINGKLNVANYGFGDGYYETQDENRYSFSKIIKSGDEVLGYQIEAKLALPQVEYATFDALTLGQLIGFDTAINDNTSGTANVRANNIFWSDGGSGVSGGAKKMGTIKLEAANYDNSTNNAAHASSADFFAQEVEKASKLNTTYPHTNAIKGTPTIDGVIDAKWANAEVQTINTVSTAVASTANITARFRTMWDENFLYILTEVYDTTDNGGKGAELEAAQKGNALLGMDSLLIGFDSNYERGGMTAHRSGYLIKGVYGGTCTNTNHYNGDGSGYNGVFHEGTAGTATAQQLANNANRIVDETFFKTVRNEYGYVMEGKIALPNLRQSAYNEFTEGQIVGLNIMVNDNTAGGSGIPGRTGQIFWASGSTSPSGFGSVILQGADYAVDAEKKVAADDTFFYYRPNITHTQKSDVVDGKYSVRFVATVKDIELFNGAGVEITNGTKTWVVEDTTAVYRALTGKEGDAGIVAIEAVDGQYYTAYEITDIPEATEDTLTVKAFVIKNGVKKYTDEVTYTLAPPAVQE